MPWENHHRTPPCVERQGGTEGRKYSFVGLLTFVDVPGGALWLFDTEGVPKYRYEIDIFWSEEDECFIACVPDLEKCAAWGMTYEEALARGHTAIRADLISRRVAGEPIPEPTVQSLADRWPAVTDR